MSPSKHVFERLKQNCFYLNVIENGTGNSNELNDVYVGESYIVWIGNNCKNINKSGLALGIFGQKDMFIFTADHSYKQVWNAMIEEMYSMNSNLKMNFTVPHHGGNAGKIDTKRKKRYIV